MAGKVKLKIIVNSVLALILLGVGVAVVFFYVHSKENAANMQDALHALELKEYNKAIELFKKVLAKDSDNETAIVKLAEIYDGMGNWPMSSTYWHTATRLNNLNADYEKKFVSATLKGRFFARMAVFFESKRNAPTMDDRLLNAYCLLVSNPQKGIEQWWAIMKDSPEAAEKTYGRLITAIFFAGDKTFEWVFKELGELAKSGDEFVEQEALIALASVHHMVRQFDKEEENLKLVYERNFFAGAPLLGEFYSNRLKFVDAIEVFEAYQSKYPTARVAMVLGELMLFTSQNDKLNSLCAKWKKASGKNNMRAAYYLEALNALATHDLAVMAASNKPIHGQVATPIAVFMDMLADVQSNDTMELESDLQRFSKLPPFFDLRPRTHVLVTLYLQDRIKARVEPKELLRLAETLLRAKLLNAKQEAEGNSVPMLVSLIGKLQDGSIQERDIADGLLKLPEDPTCLEIAITFHYSRGNFKEALKYLELLEKKEENISIGMKKLGVNILSNLGRTDDASARLMKILETDSSVETFDRAFIFFLKNTRRDDLQKVVDMAKESKELAATKTCCEAGIKLIDNDVPAALALLEPLETTDDLLLDFAGTTLANNGRTAKAIEKLSGIKPSFEGYPMVLCMLSRLHLDSGNTDMASQFAKKAFEIAPRLPEARKQMALSARAAGEWQKALEHSAPTLWEKNGDAEHKAVWIWAMEKNIASEFDAKRLLPAKNLCSQLLLYDKDNKFATENAAKIEAVLEEAKKAETE